MTPLEWLKKGEYLLNMKFLLLGTSLAVSSATFAEHPNAERGELLYENHCGGCHEAHVHMREGSKVRKEIEIREQVMRWANELELGWGGPDVDDVSDYLYLKYYKNRL